MDVYGFMRMMPAAKKLRNQNQYLKKKKGGCFAIGPSLHLRGRIALQALQQRQVPSN